VTRLHPKDPPRLLKPGQTEWQVDRLVPGGAGFLRLANGQGAFVVGALPGERIDVSEAEDHGSYLQARRWTLLEASPDRVTPICLVQSRCGGCDWMVLEYGAQLRAKAGILRDALTRTGRFTSLPEISFVASEEPLAYRSRIRLHVATDGRLGFFAAESRELVEIADCPVAHAELAPALGVLRSLSDEQRGALARFPEVELRVAPRGPRLSLRLISKDRRALDAEPLVTALSESFQVTVGEGSSDPAHDQRYPLPGGVELRAPGAAFTQVNWPVNQRVVLALLDGAAQRGVKSFCDLYCGAGNFSLPLAAAGRRGVGIEASKPAIFAAQRAAAEQGLGGLQFIAGDVRDALFGLPRTLPFDLAVLDPPRAGAREILPELIRRSPRHIAYCACDPVTLSRDLRTLCNSGYALEQLTGFDMFPQTHHFETLAWLVRES